MKVRKKDTFVAMDRQGRVRQRFTGRGLSGALKALCYVRGDLERTRKYKYPPPKEDMNRKNYDRLVVHQVVGGSVRNAVGQCGFDPEGYGTACVLLRKVHDARTGRHVRTRKVPVNPCGRGVGSRTHAIWQRAAPGQFADSDGLILKGTRKRKRRTKRRR